MTKPYKIIDLFAGAGGMTQGFVDAGFVPILAVEKEVDFAATYAENFGSHIIADDIVKVCKQGIDFQADVVIANRRRLSNCDALYGATRSASRGVCPT